MISCPSCSHLLNNKYECKNCGYSVELRHDIPHFCPSCANASTHFPADSHSKLFKIEKYHFWFQHRKNIITDVLKNSFPHAKSLCEVGCGTGGVLQHLGQQFPNLDLTAVELYTNALILMKSRVPLAQGIQADIHSLPYENEFDIVAAFDVIEHIDDDYTSMKKLAKAVKPGGGVIVTVPQHEWLWSRVDEYSCHRRRYNKSRLVDIMEQANLEVRLVHSFFSILLPAMILSRLAQKRTDNEFDPNQEMNVSPPLNKALNGVCKIERTLMKIGIPFPVGGSLIGVAYKR